MNKHSKTGLFLMELIIAILFFSIASAICIRIFVKSHQVSAKSAAETQAIFWCENVAELFRGYDGNMESVANTLSTVDHFFFPISKSKSSDTALEVTAPDYNNHTAPDYDNLTLYFDKNWNPVTSGDGLSSARYCIRCATTKLNGIRYLVMQAYNPNTQSEYLYRLEIQVKEALYE